MRRYDSLRGRRDFALVLRRGRRATATNVAIFTFTRPRGERVGKVGIIITKKVGSAVQRNRLRRRCKAILDEAWQLEGCWCVIQFRPGAASLTYARLKEELTHALARGSGGAGKSAPRTERSRR
jgi:ribonuclease P protein component